MSIYGERDKDDAETGIGTDRQTETKRWGSQTWVLTMAIFKAPARADLVK